MSYDKHLSCILSPVLGPDTTEDLTRMLNLKHMYSAIDLNETAHVLEVKHTFQCFARLGL